MSNFGIRKICELLIGIALLTACIGLGQDVVRNTPSINVAKEFIPAEPGKTVLPGFTPGGAVSTPPGATQPSVPEATVQPASPNLNLPNGELFTWRVVQSGLEKPVGLAYAADSSGRVFILEQPGRIRILRDGFLFPTPFLDITDRVGSQGFEQGLLGLAFHPDYRTNGFFFVNYTDRNGDTHIARFQAKAGNSDQAEPASEVRLLLVRQPYANHNGGELTFGPDGNLYIGLGDGGSGGDPQNKAQNLNSLLGKILRIAVDQEEPYSIPADNPFRDGAGSPEVWAFGLRNPWRFSFDRLTGDLYIGDVGQNQWEEINFLPAGSPGGTNFGWRFFEGMHPYQGTPPMGLELVPPIIEYSHDMGCSVTGGLVYRGEQLPEFQGIYLYGDYCSQRVWGMVRDAQGNWISQVLFEGVGPITSFGEDESGEIYLVNHDGQIRILERP